MSRGHYEKTADRNGNMTIVLFSLYVLGPFHSTKTSGLNFRQLPVAIGTAFSKISKKRTTSRGIPKFLETFFPEGFFPFNFVPESSRIFGWMVPISEIQKFPEFLETFLGNVCTICRSFQILESFGWMESHRPLLSQCRSSHNALENCFFQISSYSRAYVRKDKGRRFKQNM